MDTAHSSYKLQVKNLNKTFTLHNRGSIIVSGFADIDFSLKKGQLLALSGPSGAGKSSILKTLFRTYLPTSGEINFKRTDGAVIDLAKCTETMVLQLRRREIGFITQFLKVLPRVTALDAVASPLIETGETETRARQRAGDLLLHLGIRRELLGASAIMIDAPAMRNGTGPLSARRERGYYAWAPSRARREEPHAALARTIHDLGPPARPSAALDGVGTSVTARTS